MTRRSCMWFILLVASSLLAWTVRCTDSDEDVEGYVDRAISPDWEDYEILETMEMRPRGKRRVGDKKGRKNRDKGDHSETKDMGKDEEDYHVRYSTKFAFQNIDEFGLKVKYNKTENVFYGDTPPAATTEIQQPVAPFEGISQPGQPAALTFMTNNDIDNKRDSIKVIRLENEAPRPPMINNVRVQPITQHNRIRRSMLDVTPSFPQLGKMVLQNMMPRPQLPSRRAMDDDDDGDSARPRPREQRTRGQRPDRKRTHGHSASPFAEVSTRGFSSGDRSRELRECREMVFPEGENALNMNGICLVCLRNQDESGRILHSVKGCPAVDCEEFELPNPYDLFPLCCPTCKGARVPHKPEDYLDLESDEELEEEDGEVEKEDEQDGEKDEEKDENATSRRRMASSKKRKQRKPKKAKAPARRNQEESPTAEPTPAAAANEDQKHEEPEHQEKHEGRNGHGNREHPKKVDDTKRSRKQP